MIDKKEVVTFFRNKEYLKVINIFKNEYCEQIKSFLIKNNIKILEDDTFIDLTEYLKDMGYEGLCDKLQYFILNENIDEKIRIDNLLNMYNEIYKLCK